MWPSLFFLGLSAVSLLAAAACDGPVALVPTDAGPLMLEDAGVSEADAGLMVQPPAIPLFPSLPCPAGWEEIIEGEPGCAPWPAHEGPTCSSGLVRFPGDAACAALGPACPADDWSDALQARDDVLFVLAGAAADGDGSLGAPFSTLEAALGAAGDTQIIALGKGTYEEALVLERSADIRGACVSETILRAPEGSGPTVGFQVEGASTEVSISNVSLERSSLRADSGAQLTITDLHVRGSNMLAVSALEGAVITGSGLVVDAIVSNVDNGLAVALTVLSGGVIALDRVHIDGGAGFATAAENEGSVLRLSRAAIRRTTAVGDLGSAMLARDGAQITLDRASVEQTEGAAIWVLGGELSLQDVVVRENLLFGPVGRGGQAIGLDEGAVATLSRVVLEDGAAGALSATGEGTRLVATDLLVRDFVGQPEGGIGGFGVWVLEGAEASIERAVFERTRSAALLVYGAGAEIIATDLRVSETDAQLFDLRAGRAISCEEGGRASVTRGWFSQNRESGANVETGGSLTLSDVTIERTRSQLSDLSLGRGITVHSGGQLMGTRVSLLNNREAGVLVHGGGTYAHLVDLRAEGTLSKECSDTTCSTSPGGAGVAVVRGAVLELENFLVADNALLGCQVAFAQDATLTHGLVTGNPIGLNVQGDQDLEALSQGVVFRDNDVNLDSANMPIPSIELPP